MFLFSSLCFVTVHCTNITKPSLLGSEYPGDVADYLPLVPRWEETWGHQPCTQDNTRHLVPPCSRSPRGHHTPHPYTPPSPYRSNTAYTALDSTFQGRRRRFHCLCRRLTENRNMLGSFTECRKFQP